MKPKRLDPSEFESVYRRVPRLCVEVVIKTNEGVLLTKRAIEPAKGKWHTPGGTVLKGERLADTVIRVAREETGLHVKPLQLLGALEYSFPGYFSQPIALVYQAKHLSGRPRTDEQSTDIRFFKTIPKNIIPEHGAFLKKQFRMKAGRKVE